MAGFDGYGGAELLLVRQGRRASIRYQTKNKSGLRLDFSTLYVKQSFGITSHESQTSESDSV